MHEYFRRKVNLFSVLRSKSITPAKASYFQAGLKQVRNSHPKFTANQIQNSSTIAEILEKPGHSSLQVQLSTKIVLLSGWSYLKNIQETTQKKNGLLHFQRHRFNTLWFQTWIHICKTLLHQKYSGSNIFIHANVVGGVCKSRDELQCEALWDSPCPSSSCYGIITSSADVSRFLVFLWLPLTQSRMFPVRSL